MAVVMALTSLPISFAQAGMVSTQSLIEQHAGETDLSAQAPSDRERIRAVLARDDVREQMIALGIDAPEAEARLAALTDQEVADIAGKLDQLPAGEGVGGILVIIFVVFGVLVLMDALGIFDLLPFVCGPGQCVRQAAVESLAIEPAAGPTQLDPYAYDTQQHSNYRSSGYQRDQFDRYNGRQHRRSFEQDPYAQQLPDTSVRSAGRNYQQERFGPR
jgi:hypothetical protein